MPLIYRLAADAVVIVHVAYVLFVIFGLLLTMLGAIVGWQWIRDRWFRTIHLTMIGIVVFETWMGITCPLSTWEWQLREWAGDATYRGDFIANMLDRWLFWDGPEWVFTAGYSTFGLAVLATWIWAPPRFGKQTAVNEKTQMTGSSPGSSQRIIGPSGPRSDRLNI